MATRSRTKRAGRTKRVQKAKPKARTRTRAKARPPQQPIPRRAQLGRSLVSRLRSRCALSVRAFLSAAFVMAEPKPEYLVDTLLFPSSPFSIFGLPGVGKSLIALLLAVCVATRRPFLGRAVNLAQPVSVIYVVAEGGRFVGARLRALCEEYGLSAADLENLHILRRPVALTDMIAVEEFIETVRLLLTDRPAPALILFDTLTKCLGRAGANENDPLDMALLADRIDAIIEETGAAVGVIDHTGWAGKHERGHSNKRGNVETAILVEAGRDHAIRLTCEKANHADEFQPVRLSIVKRADAAVVTLPEVPLLPPSSSTAKAERAAAPLSHNEAKALRGLANEGGGVLPFGRWRSVSGVANASFDRARQRLLMAGLVQQEGPDERPRYALTPAGRARAAEPEVADA